MVIFGGFNGQRMNAEVYLYSFIANRWISPRKESYSPEERDSHTSSVYQNAIYIFGGRGWDFYGRKTMYFNDLHKLVADEESIKWKQVKYTGYVPSKRLLHSSLVFQDKLYVFGGRCEDTRLNDLCYYDFMTNIFHSVDVTGDIPSSRTSRSLCNFQNNFVLFGGFDDDGYKNDLWRFDVTRQKWKLVHNDDKTAPPARCAHFTIGDAVNNRIYVYGGETAESDSLNDLYHCEMSIWSNSGLTFQCVLLQDASFLDVDLVFQN